MNLFIQYLDYCCRARDRNNYSCVSWSCLFHTTPLGTRMDHANYLMETLRRKATPQLVQSRQHQLKWEGKPRKHINQQAWTNKPMALLSPRRAPVEESLHSKKAFTARKPSTHTTQTTTKQAGRQAGSLHHLHKPKNTFPPLSNLSNRCFSSRTRNACKVVKCFALC